MDDHDRIKRKAVALKYNAEADAAPRVVAKGDRLLAERIIAIAKENGVPIHEDPDLVSLLAALEIDREIPDALYRAVAEVLAFVYTVNEHAKA
ncbi:MAG: EscU/YscU/HrcU family type III secretion system export apparatus switch protein [Candidatus Hydrogenedentes bacterium]|nr:EscU/YscU/HrcU family type III secretion system export apparatus switch protein [Candidatus Hydrogenedentota bacterium]